MLKSTQQALAQRIRQIRTRHFGARGARQFAERLGLSLAQYRRFERGVIPPGEIMIRLCEITGEDLQWLLVGRPSRATLIVTGARHRHRDLLARLARALDQQPALAHPLEAFVDLLLTDAGGKRQRGTRALPPPAPALIPIYDGHELPEDLPALATKTSTMALAADAHAVRTVRSVHLSEPTLAPSHNSPPQVELLSLRRRDGRPRQFVRSPWLAGCLRGVFAMRINDDQMRPMFRRGDAVLVAPGIEPKLGRPALCRVAGRASTRCRIWLGRQSQYVNLASLARRSPERVKVSRLCWSLEVLYRVWDGRGAPLPNAS